MPLTPSKTRQILESIGHTPQKKLGQNFLIDGNIVRKSLELASVSAKDTLVEIGPGLGTLTQTLLQTGATVYAIEKDPRLHQHLTDTLVPEFPDTFKLTLGDALEHPLACLPDSAHPFRIVANLPYAISTPWLDAVLSGPLPESMTLMLQEEAAKRFISPHGQKSFGAISIFTQSAYDIAGKHKVSAACFYPQPKVGSILLSLSKKQSPLLFDAESKQVIRDIFGKRRKQIGSIKLENGSILHQKWLKKLENDAISPKTRAEDIPLEAWQSLSSL